MDEPGKYKNESVHYDSDEDVRDGLLKMCEGMSSDEPLSNESDDISECDNE